MVKQANSVIRFEPDNYGDDPFRQWKKNLHSNEEVLIACIPFVRNLAEYCEGTEEGSVFLKLTSLLHIKEDTKEITIEALEEEFKKILKGDMIQPFEFDETQSVYTLILDTANTISTEDEQDSLNLEKKIVLSMATRLLAEKFMINKLKHDQSFNLCKIKSNQTSELYKRYKNGVSHNTLNLSTLERVNLMTPANIHLNSFMYEPILDLKLRKKGKVILG